VPRPRCARAAPRQRPRAAARKAPPEGRRRVGPRPPRGCSVARLPAPPGARQRAPGPGRRRASAPLGSAPRCCPLPAVPCRLRARTRLVRVAAQAPARCGARRRGRPCRCWRGSPRVRGPEPRARRAPGLPAVRALAGEPALRAPALLPGRSAVSAATRSARLRTRACMAPPRAAACAAACERPTASKRPLGLAQPAYTGIAYDQRLGQHRCAQGRLPCPHRTLPALWRVRHGTPGP